MLGLIRYNVVAYFNRPIGGRSRISSTEQGRADVYATTPESAARMFYWRLGSDERAVTFRIIVWAPTNKTLTPPYDGPTIVFGRDDGGKFVVIEERG